MKTKEEIMVRINEYRAMRDKYLEAFSKGNFGEAATINYSHVNSRLDELRWVLIKNSSDSEKAHDITGEM